MHSITRCLGSIALSITLLWSAACARTMNSKLTGALRDFKTFYPQKLKQHGIVGSSSFMLLHDNEVIAKEFYGLAHQEQNRAVDEETIYHWASITKTFTSLAIMQLRDRGLLRLDDPIIKYVPELKDAHNPFGEKNRTPGRTRGCWIVRSRIIFSNISFHFSLGAQASRLLIHADSLLKFNVRFFRPCRRDACAPRNRPCRNNYSSPTPQAARVFPPQLRLLPDTH